MNDMPETIWAHSYLTRQNGSWSENHKYGVSYTKTTTIEERERAAYNQALFDIEWALNRGDIGFLIRSQKTKINGLIRSMRKDK